MDGEPRDRGCPDHRRDSNERLLPLTKRGLLGSAAGTAAGALAGCTTLLDRDEVEPLPVEAPQATVDGFTRATTDWVAWRDLDVDPAGAAGVDLSSPVAAVELDRRGDEVGRVPAELLPPPDDGSNRGTLLLHLDGETKPEEPRRFAVETGATDAGTRPDGMRVDRDGEQLRVGNRWYEVTHDLGQGGAITEVAFGPSGERVTTVTNDHVGRTPLSDDADPDVNVRGGDGSLGVIVDVRARFGDDPDAGPAVHYRYRYDVGSPLVRMAAVVPEQPATSPASIRLLDYGFETDDLFDEPAQLLTANSGPANGELVERTLDPWPGGEHDRTAGPLWRGDAGALGYRHPTHGDDTTDDFVGDWAGERKALTATLYVGPDDCVDDYLALADGPDVRVALPDVSERIFEGERSAAGRDGPAATLASGLFAAARSRVDRVLEPSLAEHLVAEAEAVLDGADGSDGTVHRETDRFVAVANERTTLLFRKHDGSVSLDGLFRDGHGFVVPTRDPRPLWKTTFRDTETDSRVATTAARATETTVDVDESPDGGRRLTFESSVPVDDSRVDAETTVAVEPGDGFAKWGIDVQPDGDRLGVWDLLFPIVGGVGPDLGNHDLDYVAPAGSNRVPNPRLSGHQEGPHRWVHRYVYRRGRYRTYYQGTTGLFLGAHDPELSPVGVQTYNGGRRGLEFGFRHRTEEIGEPGAGHAAEAVVDLGTFDGDWFDATRLHRAWLTDQSWVPDETIADNADRPEWVKRIVSSIRYGGSRGAGGDAFDDTLTDLGFPPTINLYYHAWDLDRDPTVLESHSDSKHADTPDYPLSRPPDFDRVVNSTQQEGMHVTGYTLNLRWDVTSESFVEEEAAAAAYYRSSGSPSVSYPWSIPCHSTDTWQDKMAQVGGDLAEMGVDGVYHDLGGGDRGHQWCVTEDHGHPSGSGPFVFEGHREALRHYRDAARETEPAFALTGEGPQTYFVGVMDGFTHFAKPMPELAALSHDYIRPVGNKRSVTKAQGWPLSSDDRNGLTPAKHFAWGSTIGRFRAGGADYKSRDWTGGISFHETNPGDLAHFRNLIWHKYVARPWLNLGTMRRPPRVTDVEPEPERELFPDSMIPSAVWEAPDGTHALVFANGWHSRETRFGFTFDPAEYDLPADGTLTLYRLTPVGDPPDVEPAYEPVTTIDGVVERRETLDAGDVLILVAQAEPGPPESVGGAGGDAGGDDR